MSVAGICRGILLLYVRKLPQLFLWALLFLTLPVLGAVSLIAVFLYDMGFQRVLTNGETGLLAVAVVLGWGVATTWFYAVAAIVISLAVENWRASTRQILRRLRGRISLHLLITAVVSCVIFIAIYAAAAWIGALKGGSPLIKNSAIIILGIVCALFFLRAITAWCLTPALIVLEELSFYRAMRRSSRLLSGHRWRTLGAMLLCNGVLSLLLYLAVSIESRASSSSFPVFPLWVCTISLFAGGGICLPIFLYFDVRCRKEAFHLDTLREY